MLVETSYEARVSVGEGGSQRCEVQEASDDEVVLARERPGDEEVVARVVSATEAEGRAEETERLQ